MPDCMYGIPAARGLCLIPNRGWEVQPLLVTENGDGTMNRVVAPSRAPTGVPVDTWAFDREGPFSWDAMQSAWAMLAEHDQRILDNNQTPSTDILSRKVLWRQYYNLSKQQFSDDATRLAKGLQPELTFSADGIAPYPPERLQDISNAKSLGRIKKADALALDEIIRVYGNSLTTAKISSVLTTNPFRDQILQLWLESQLPAVQIQIQQAQDNGEIPTKTVPPAPIVGDISQGVKIDPSLPGSAANTQSAQQSYERVAAQYSNLASEVPEAYLSAQAAAAKVAAEVRDANYWQQNYPKVEILAAYNPALSPDELSTPWPGPGLAPLVNVTFTPRIRPPPEKGFLADNPLFGQIVGIVALAIPVVGPIISAGVNYATNNELTKWAHAWQPNASQFAPQYASPYGHGGEAFNLPMPLDRAQIMVRQPWYASPMVDQFAEEVRVNNLVTASQGYAQFVDRYQEAGSTTSRNATPAQGGGISIQSTSIAPVGGALPIFAAGLLLVLGAPIIVPLGVLVLLERKK